MMGRTHALTGVAAGIAVTYGITLSVPAAIAGTFICAGSALVPDIDHKDSTITKTFGPITKIVSFVVRKISGGHRIGTHSFLGIAAIGAMAQYGVQNRYTLPGAILLCFLMCLAIGGAVRLLRIPGWFDDLAPIPVVIGIVRFTHISLDMVPLAIMLGCLIHVAGDVATKGGCPLWWPFSFKRIKLDLFKTDGFTERWIITPVVIVCIFAGIFWKLLDNVM
jgi:membrane-bound metal-dependent hydrolase YbcI (DUF457 family)